MEQLKRRFSCLGHTVPNADKSKIGRQVSDAAADLIVRKFKLVHSLGALKYVKHEVCHETNHHQHCVYINLVRARV